MTKLLKFFRVTSIILLLFTGVNAIIAGIVFIIDPTGGKMGMSTSYLSKSPFNNYLLPGITLFVVNGLLNIIAAIAGIRKYKNFPILIILQGLLLSGWIILQAIFVRDFNFLHFSMLGIGITLLALGRFLYK